MSEDKEQGYISSKLLNALGGRKETTNLDGQEVSLVNDGAYLWGVEDGDKGRGILNHVLLARRTALALAKELKTRKTPGFEEINLGYVADAATLHDVTKLYGEDREKLTAEQKKAAGLPDNFREIMDEVDQTGIDWLSRLGFPPQVYEAIKGHDFPTAIIDDPYWKIVLIADYMSAQQIMTVRERLDDVRIRWIDERLACGEKPRIEPERFDVAEKNIESVAGELFSAIGITEQQFIAKYNLRSPDSADRGEKFIRRTSKKGVEKEAKRSVGLVEKVATRENYGKISYREWRKQNPHNKSSE